MDKKTLYFELLDDMEKIVNKHRKTRQENLDFDPTQNIPVEPPENIRNPAQFTPFGSLKIAIDGLYRDSRKKTED